MNIVFATSECFPYASTGGLSDVSSSLPAALKALKHQTIIVMPMYRQIIEGRYEIEDTGMRFDIPVGYRTLRADIWKTKNTEVPVYFVRRDEYFDRTYLYSLPERDYEDNLERFVFYQKAVVAIIDAALTNTDIVHCNDWQTGLIPLYLKHGINGVGRTQRERTVFTVHNLAYQGIFPANEFPTTSLPYSCFNINTMEFYGGFSLMKAGITSSDQITTVSQQYAAEIQTETFGAGLEGVLQSRAEHLAGIINGVNDDVWNPATDTLIAQNYSADDLQGKLLCRDDLLKKFNLAADASVPVISMISRMADQKGFDLITEYMPTLMKKNVRFILLGSGQREYETAAGEWMDRWPKKCACHIGYNTELSHQIEAGADIFLMPSKFEPCGLNQMYSLKYGTLPIVNPTGGLKDTIQDLDDHPDTGNGFAMKAYTPTAFDEKVSSAIKLYKNQQTWQEVMKRAMQQNFSWTESARRYTELYHYQLQNKKLSTGHDKL